MTLHVAPHLTREQLVAREKSTKEANERLKWIAVRSFADGRSAAEIAELLGRKPHWVWRTVKLYNEEGPEGLKEARGQHRSHALLDAEGLAALEHALRTETPPGGGLWNSPKVALWMGQRLGRPVHVSIAWRYLKKLEWSLQVPVPRHPDGDKEAQEAFKKGGSSSKSSGLRSGTLAPW